MLKQGKTLASREDRLSDPACQAEVLNSALAGDIEPFEIKLGRLNLYPLRPALPEILQVNLGKMCNQVCRHCHVDAGPDRKEIMQSETMEACLEVLRTGRFHTLDLTGGAPELNPLFRDFVALARPLVKTIIVRSNLTIILANNKYLDLPAFFREHGIEVVSSLPFYSRSRTDAQRGEGVFETSVKALKLLNEAGYGRPDTGMVLNLVYNPSGSFLPGDQKALEFEFKKRLLKDHGIVFNNLYTITNMPISRFLEFLVRAGNLADYMTALADAFNPLAAEGVMCRNTLSVGWDGHLYDCDFNQMLDMKIEGVPHIRGFDADALSKRSIRTGRHCYGCTAGAGSSCAGTTA